MLDNLDYYSNFVFVIFVTSTLFRTTSKKKKKLFRTVSDTCVSLVHYVLEDSNRFDKKLVFFFASTLLEHISDAFTNIKDVFKYNHLLQFSLLLKIFSSVVNMLIFFFLGKEANKKKRNKKKLKTSLYDTYFVKHRL